MSSTPTQLREGVEYRALELPLAPAGDALPVDPVRFDLLVLACSEPQRSHSGEARRAMERLAAEHASTEIRVATLTPSGRPIALQSGDTADVQVSASHAAGLVAAVCRTGREGIGVDLVDPSSAGPGLDWWDGPQADKSRTNAERAAVWAAREAAYKAAKTDLPFSPAAIAVRLSDEAAFDWRIDSAGDPIAGRGRFFSIADRLVAVAVQLESAASTAREDEVVVCS